MKNWIAVSIISTISGGLVVVPARAQPVGTGFTYQGQVQMEGVPLNATADFEFRLFSASDGGAQMGQTLARDNITIENGLFNSILDFGAAAFDGQLRYLEVTIRSPAGAGAYVTLSPRQPITATPYAIRTRGIAVDSSANPNVGIGTNTPGAKLHVKGAEEGIRIDGPTGGAGCAAFLTFRDANGARTGFVGDGSIHDTNIFLASDTGSVTLFAGGQSALTANNAGNVGIGTASPNKKLTVDGDMEIGDNSGDYHHLRIGGGNSDGFLYGSFARFGDGIHMGYNYYADAGGNNRVVRSDGQTSRISMGYGSISLAVGSANQPPVDRFTIDSSGTVRMEYLPYGDYDNLQRTPNGVLFVDTSTRRHKEKIKPLDADFERLLDAQPVTYTRPGRPDRWEIGYVAEDMHDLGLTNLVQYDDEGRPSGYNYEKSLLYLVEIAKAQRKQIAGQSERLAEFEEALRELSNRLDVIEQASIRP
jgi:hypothetical protein